MTGNYRAEYSVTGKTILLRNRIARLCAAALMSITIILPQAVVPAAAASERALYLYYTHTKETGRIVFKRNGAYVQSGLNELNRFLRDWRRNEPAQMDPRLFDLVWEVYQEVGATQPINVVSAYRSPKTNEMLRATSSGVAENSQHTKGHAMDFFIPGINLSKLRAVAMRKQVGGVGFYPTSGSPFVHLDTGSVRAWPRMTRAQLQEVFPDGRTMHVPTDGRPLSQEGYQLAMAEWKKCHAYPCNGSSSGTQIASAGNSGGNSRSLVDMLFGGKGQQAAAPAARQAAPAPAPVQMAAIAPQPAPMPTLSGPVGASLAAPIPAMRSASAPSSNNASAPLEVASLNTPVAIPFSTTGSAPLDQSELASLTEAPVPARKSETLRVATASTIASNDAVTALASFNAPVPQSRLIMSNPPEAVTAYLPPAQQALETIIENTTTAAVIPAQRPNHLPTVTTDSIQTASLGGSNTANAYTGLFDNTFGATQQGANPAMAAALANHIANKSGANTMRPAELIAPDLEHVAEVFLAPVALTSDHFAVIFDHDEADFDPSTAMGKFVTKMAVGDFAAIPAHDGFVIN